ncbi:hypothetical protein VB773_13010 [Haloarculaceae archaeon H-GB2-1]|nr:hypothetical protein [Haloarculaceae archaeon H-GB1-1]MEA5386909.1 hypothetical protein [Haloarculaceae archaeon H-GB11]MEA5408391.1 hypothetical protein [Haloarculaceae archaeon H-GB2-1]
MAATGRQNGSPTAASDVAARLREAGFVRLVAAPDGDALAATGLLARTLDALDTPFQASVTDFDAADRSTDADLTVAVGLADATADLALSTPPVSATAFDVVQECDGSPVVALAMAGLVAADEVGGPVADAVTASGFERHPGVAVPTVDPADGLAHSTLVCAPFSGDEDATREFVSDLDLPEQLGPDDRRRLASRVALAVVGHADATDRASAALERALRPYHGGPFETIAGYADVLDCVAREAPGVAVALALGHDVRADALGAWRDHARRAHDGLRAATTGRYDGLFVVRGETDRLPVETVARLARDFRSPEPAVLALTEGRAAATTLDDTRVGPAVRDAAAALDGTAEVTGQGARATFAADTASFITAFREAL